MTESFDVIVVGFGYAGAVAAIAAHDAGARVLILEKRDDPGGISVCSAGGIRCGKDVSQMLAYLVATNGGTTPESVLATLASGMAELPRFIGGLAEAVGATATVRDAVGNYPFLGHDCFAFVNIDAVPGFDAEREFPSVRGSPAGARLFKVMLENVRLRGIETRYDAAVTSLVLERGRVAGVRCGEATFLARGGVVLATGGFEGAPDLQRQFWPLQPVLSAAIRTNTGDGMRMAQSAGAALWHMWHYHGSYGFRHPDAAYPFGIRLKRLPDWLPGAPRREDVTMSWILLDRSGKRFMNEYEPYMQDTGHRSLEPFDFISQSYARLPALLVVDARGRELYPLSAPTWHDAEVASRFADVAPRAMDEAVLRSFDTLDALARAFGIAPATLESSIRDWNALTASAGPDPLGRPAESRAPVATPPFSAAYVWPIVSNTQGGPVHDERQRVIDAFGQPIEGLFEAGEIGSVFGHVYLSGGNLAECCVGGRIAGCEAAATATGRRAVA
jgi:succinate dehydrogenase/fumarate reductase flavoprotein subunit